ncbi:unnamed protein product [Gadus morhua 'NCC']
MVRCGQEVATPMGGAHRVMRADVFPTAVSCTSALAWRRREGRRKRQGEQGGVKHRPGNDRGLREQQHSRREVEEEMRRAESREEGAGENRRGKGDGLKSGEEDEEE